MRTFPYVGTGTPNARSWTVSEAVRTSPEFEEVSVGERASHFGMGVESTSDEDAEVGKVTGNCSVCANGAEVSVSVSPVVMGNDDALSEESDGEVDSYSSGLNLCDNPYSVYMGHVEEGSSVIFHYPPSSSYLPLAVSADPSPSCPLPTSSSVPPSELFPPPCAHLFLPFPPSASFLFHPASPYQTHHPRYSPSWCREREPFLTTPSSLLALDRGCRTASGISQKVP